MNGANKLALGTVQFGLSYGVANKHGRVSTQMANAILNYANSVDFDTLDTAIAYGSSESVLGNLGINKWRVVTKLPSIPVGVDNWHQWTKSQVLQSLERLHVSALYGLMLHSPMQLLERNGAALYSALLELKNTGVVSKVGVSVYSMVELELLLDKFAIDIVQAPLNILDRNLIHSGMANCLQDAGIEVHTRSAFLQGLLLMSDETRPKKFEAWDSVWRVWKLWLAETGLTPLQACIRYVCSLDSIDRVVVGVDTVTQLQEIVKAADGPLSSLPDFGPLQDPRLLNPSTWCQL
jgi:aryl-alcohol dehydrogenase-like predicted oxidoreductase